MNAVIRLIQFGHHIERVRVLSFNGTHCLLLTYDSGCQVAIKSGFSSGYGGEGPNGFSYILQLLDSHDIDVDEIEVSKDLIQRVDDSALTHADIDAIESVPPIIGNPWRDHLFERDWDRRVDGTLWREFPPVIPFSIVERRLVGVAIAFWRSPDSHLLDGYRRLEDSVRKRTGSESHGGRLFADAFSGPRSPLYWPDLDAGEHTARVNLFTGTYTAYRNRRAHRELRDTEDDSLEEFVLLNHLFRLEALAVQRPSVPDQASE